MQYRGHIKDGVVVFEGDDRPPEGTTVSVHVVEATSEEASPKELVAGVTSADETKPEKNWLLEFAGVIKGLPSDASEQLDHYLYGTPKR